MAQFLRPDSDVSAGSWAASTGTDLWAMLDESSPNDSDYITVAGSPGETTCEVGLSDPGLPPGAGDHIVRWRHRGDSGFITQHVELWEGGTQIAAWSATAAASYNTRSRTLTGGEVSAITDYSNLRLRFRINPAGDNPRVSWAEMEVPDGTPLLEPVDLTAGAPTLGSPALTFTPLLTPADLTAGAPTLGVPGLTSGHNFAGEGVTAGYVAVADFDLPDGFKLLDLSEIRAVTSEDYPTEFVAQQLTGSPNGRYIAYTRLDGGATPAALHWREFANGVLGRADLVDIDIPTGDAQLRWSPDGTKAAVLYSQASGGPLDGTNFAVYEFNGKRFTRTATALLPISGPSASGEREYLFAWSHDGEYIVAGEQQGSANAGLSSWAADDLTHADDIETSAGSTEPVNVVASPVSGLLVYGSADLADTRAATLDGEGRLSSVSVTGGGSRFVGGAFTPDGAHFVSAGGFGSGADDAARVYSAADDGVEFTGLVTDGPGHRYRNVAFLAGGNRLVCQRVNDIDVYAFAEGEVRGLLHTTGSFVGTFGMAAQPVVEDGWRNMRGEFNELFECETQSSGLPIFSQFGTGTEFQVQFHDDAQDAATPRGELLRLYFREIDSPGTVPRTITPVRPAERESHYDLLPPVDGPPTRSSADGVFRIGVFYQVAPGEELTPDQQERLDGLVHNLYAFWNTWLVPSVYSAVEVTGHRFPSNCDNSFVNGCRYAARAYASSQGITVDQYVVFGGSNPGVCGRANICASHATVMSNCSLPVSSTIHESGHANIACFGHAGRLAADGTYVQYGDGFCVMGTQNTRGLNALMQYHAGAHNPAGAVEVTETTQLRLAPIEWAERDRWANEVQTVRVVKTHEGEDYEYFISRRKYPHPYGLTAPGQVSSGDRVFIHHRGVGPFLQELSGTITTSSNWSIEVKRLGPNSEVTLPGDIKVRHVSAGRDTSVVDIHYDASDPAPDPAPAAVEPTRSGALTTADSGLWYNPLTSGQGFTMIVLQNTGQVLLHYFGFDRGDDRKWYFLDGHLQGNGTGECTIYERLADHSLNSLGTAKVYRSGDKLVVTWITNEHGRTSFELTRLL